jgi:small subunit ribosomal protein S34
MRKDIKFDRNLKVSLPSTSMATIARSLQRLLPRQSAPPALKDHPASLYQVLSRTPNVVGKEIHQIRWSQKHISDSFWHVTRAQFKCNGTHGKAWGKLYWKGQFRYLERKLVAD